MPRGIQTVRKNGREYHYYAPGRGTDRAGDRVALGKDAQDPLFWQKLRKAKGEHGTRNGSFAALIAAYRASPEFSRLRPVSQKDYTPYLDRLDRAAGDRLVADMTSADVYELRDAMQATPVAANYMLTILRTLIKWGIPRKYRTDNPVIGVERIQVDDNGARPWPEEGYAFVMAHAPMMLRRAAYLGRSTGQRAGDLVRMRPCDLAGDGITLKIGKKRETEHFVPLTTANMAEIQSWGVTDLDLFLKSPAGGTLTAHHLGNIWRRWRASKKAEPIAGLVMTLHGLRATAVVDRQMKGTPDNGIADELGLSVQMVRRYSRFADKAQKARASRDRRERGANEIVNSVVRLKT